MAVLSSLFANANRDPKRRHQPFKVDDFMVTPKQDSEREVKMVPVTSEEQWNQFRSMMRQGAK